MGVPGLWDLLRPAAVRSSLSTLARDAFYVNGGGLRALKLGIDASIWIFHAQLPTYGENPFLRTIFFKITVLLQQPVLPVFVFDGPNKPMFKRGQAVAGHFGTGDHKSRQFKELLDECGIEWWNAPGEAEAELAVMNRQGKIDAVLSDDVDALLFGATCVIRNNSPTLSGASASSTKANSSKGNDRHYEVYRSDAIRDLWAKKEGTKLVTEEDCRMAMCFVGLFSGGDYDAEGVAGIGPTIAFGLANAGLSDHLRLFTSDRSRFLRETATMRSNMIEELRTNSTNHIGRRNPTCATKLFDLPSASFLPSSILAAYLTPTTSPLTDPTQGWPGFGQGLSSSRRGKGRMSGRGDMEGMARACERFFEWGTKDLVGRKFSGEGLGVWLAEITNEAGRAVESRIGSQPITPPGDSSTNTTITSRITSFFQNTASQSCIPSKTIQILSQPNKFPDVPPHFLKIASKRLDPTNQDLMEYRLVIDQTSYLARVQGAMQGYRPDPKDLPSHRRVELGLVDKAVSNDIVEPNEHSTEVRIWVAEYLLREAWPSFVNVFEDGFKKKEAAKNKAKIGAGRRKGQAKPVVEAGVDTAAFKSFFETHSTQAVSFPREIVSTSEEEEEIEEIEEIRFLPRLHNRVSTSAVTTKESTALRIDSSSSLSSAPPSSPMVVDSPSSSSTDDPPSSSPIPVRRSRTTRLIIRDPSSAVSTPSKASKPVVRTRKIITSSSPSSTPRQARPKISKAKPTTIPRDVIDLCSSDEDTPKPPRTAAPPALSRSTRSPSITILPILSTSTKTNTATATASTRRTKKTITAKATASSEQTMLGFATLARSSQVSSQGKGKVNSPMKVDSPVKVRRQAKYVEISEMEDEEVFDETRRTRL